MPMPWEFELRRQVAHSAVYRPRAVAVRAAEHRGHALLQVVDARRKLRVGEAALAVGVHVDEAGRDVLPGSIDCARGRVAGQVTDGGDCVADYAKVGFDGVGAGAVEDPAADYGYVEIRRYC